MIYLVTSTYGSDVSMINLKKEFDKISKPSNISQLLNSIFNNDTGAMYLNKESLIKLNYFVNYNIPKINEGIEKAEKIKEVFRPYMTKIEQYLNHLNAYNYISYDGNAFDKSDTVLVQSEINNKIRKYENHVLVMTGAYNQLNNLISLYFTCKLTLEEIKETTLPGIVMEAMLNRGIIKTEENIQALKSILEIYRTIVNYENVENLPLGDILPSIDYNNDNITLNK